MSAAEQARANAAIRRGTEMRNSMLSKPAKSTRRGGGKGKKKEELQINKKILIIDDEPDFVEAFRRTLEAKSYQVMTTSSKEQAQEMLRSRRAGRHCSRYMAPAGQAFSMYQWLEQHPRYKDIPLLVIDARYEERPIRGWRRHEGLQLGC